MKKKDLKVYSLEEMLTENYGEKGTVTRDAAEKEIDRLADEMAGQFQTPMEVATYMAKLIPQESYHILEPTSGQVNLKHAAGNVAFERGKSMLIDSPKNFFDLGRKIKYDSIIMNPPFSEKHAFGIPKDLELKGMRMGYYILKECMTMSDNIIALMPWFTLLDSDVRMRELKAFGIKSLTAMPRKTFQYARIQTVVIELQNGWDKETIFKTFTFSGL